MVCIQVNNSSDINLNRNKQAKQSVLPDNLFKRSWLKLSLDDCIKSLETNYWVIARFL